MAARAAALASDDTPVPNKMLINALKASGFTELVGPLVCLVTVLTVSQAESSFAKQCETSVRDSRRVGFKEMAKEFKRRADN